MPQVPDQVTLYEWRVPTHRTLGHEHLLKEMQARLEQMPQAARVRRQTVEHTFGTLRGSGPNFIDRFRDVLKRAGVAATLLVRSLSRELLSS